jgi:hypothetical protein
MDAAAVIWILTMPFAVGALVHACGPVNGLVARHLTTATTLGWTGVALLVAGAFALDGPAGNAALLAGAPMTGLSYWTRGDGGGGDGPEEDDDPPPDDGAIDWDRFMRDVERWKASRPRAPRTPVA